MSYARLVLDLHDSQTDAELLDEVVLLVVERGTAEIGIPIVRRRRKPCSSFLSSQVCSRVSITRSAIISIACSSGSSSHVVP
jgi:hypothetical protein